MNTGKTLITFGIFLFFLGCWLTWAGKIPFLGKLPGDFRFETDHFSFYFPLTSCLVISLLLSLVFWLFRR